MGELDDMRVVRVDGGGIGIQKKYRPNQEGALPGTWWDSPGYSASESGTNVLKNLFGHKDFDFPKSINLVIDNLRVSRLAPDGSVLDYFAGSGTTAHAVVELNREDGGNRKYLLAEMGDYFDTVLKPRILKVVYAAEWKDGKPKSRDNGISHCFKYIRLESYEDALNNLELEDRSADLLGLPEDVAEDYLLRYSLDVETRAGLLNLERFEDPFNCTLRICNRETGETEPKAVDLPETFNYLLGLRVRTMRMRDGFLVIEGENPAAEAVLVIWRNVREKDNAALEKFFAESLRIKPADAPYAAIYVNGDTTLDDPQKKILLTEQVFHELMFDARGLQA
jgi:adenine-specific DNA-methyltransferase